MHLTLFFVVKKKERITIKQISRGKERYAYMEEIISLEHVTKTYGKSRGIEDVTLRVKQGEIFGFMGPNGAGKSTTIRSMLGFIKTDTGTIQLFEKDITKDKISILQKIGYMPSETMFYHKMKVIDILDYSMRLRNVDCKQQQRALCERLQLDPQKKIESLSLGNRKKVSIVCAMQHEPDLYIFDEPTSGLDPLIQKEFFDLILEKQKEQASIFFSSHVLSEVKNYCKRGAIIKEGKIIRTDTIEQLFSSGVKKITIFGRNNLPEQLGHLNVKNLQCFDQKVEFYYKKDTIELLKQILQYPCKDIRIEEPDLETVFMHYY